jgi:hypothetical protein
MVRNASQQAARGSVTKRLLCLPVQSIYECQTRGEEQGHCPPRGEADAQTRKLCHAKMRSRAPSKPYLIATFLLRFQRVPPAKPTGGILRSPGSVHPSCCTIMCS